MTDTLQICPLARQKLRNKTNSIINHKTLFRAFASHSTAAASKNKRLMMAFPHSTLTTLVNKLKPQNAKILGKAGKELSKTNLV